MSKNNDELFGAAYLGDIEKIEEYIAQGSDVNSVESGGSLLMSAISSFDVVKRKELVQYLLDKGADPNFMGDDNCGVVFEAVLMMDAEVMELLLSAGADPNFLIDLQSLYDCADTDYQYSMFEFSLPFAPSSKDQETEDAWLDFLDRCADKNNVEKPMLLRVLRKYGAKTTLEMKESDLL